MLLRLALLFFFAGQVEAQGLDTAKPEHFVFGASVDEIQAALSPYCSSLKLRSIVPITAPLAEHTQVQIDCDGYVYGGADRKVELVFQDDQLDIVWILISSDEIPLFVNSFTETLGEPSFEIEFGTVYLQANAAVRIEPAEVLYASERQVQAMLEQLAGE